MNIRTILSGSLFISVLVFGASLVLAAPPAQPPGGSSHQQRVVQRKKERNIKLDQRDLKRLEQRCITVQGNVRRLQQSTSPVITKRYKTYQRIDAKLWYSIGQLKLAERDTHELEKRRAVLANKAEAFRKLTENYQQTLDDIVVINCRNDLIGFKALVETGRIYHEQLRGSTTDIQNFIVNEVKPILNEHAEALQPKPSTEEDE